MVVKEGYKNTEVGVIPEDWEVKTLEEVAVFSNGKAHEQFIKEDADYIVVNSKFVATEGKVFKNSIVNHSPLEKGDIAMVMSDVPNGRALAKCYLIPKNNKYALNQRICSIKSKDFVNNSFLFLILNRNEYYLSFDSGSGQTNLRRNDVLECPIPLPSLPEQQSIATVLSDMDNLIQALEKKLAKKELIKKGAMQQLLEPKEGWERKMLAQIGNTYGGLSGKSKADFSNCNSQYIPFMNIMKNPIIDTEYLDSVYIKPNEFQNTTLKGDLFFNGSSETPDEVGLCSVLLENISSLYLNSFCFGFRLYNQNEIDGLYISYYFRSNFGREKMAVLAQGATRYNLSKANFLKLEIDLPSFNEQTHISQILFDMDNEIESLQEKLSKYKQLKQGLMQELLTGRIRLV